MGFMDIFNDIKTGQFDNLYLFYGVEEYTKQQALSQMIDKLINPALKDINYQELDGKSVAVGDIIVASETLPLMSEKRLIVVKDYEGLNKKTSDDDKLKNYLVDIPKTTCLLFYTRDKVDKRTSIYKALKKYGSVYDFERLNNPDLRKWTSRAFRDNAKEITSTDLNYFLFQVGDDLEDILSEIKKLSSYAGSDKRITKDMIDKLITPSPEHTVFQLIDAVSTRKRGEALELLDFLLNNGQNIFGVISLISKQFKVMYSAKYYINKGYSQKSIINKIDAHPYTVKKAISQCQNFTVEQLKEGLNKCLELDYGIKSGRVDDKLGLELLLFKMTS